MTEAEWRAADDPSPMLAFLAGRASPRKLRLWACEALRHLIEAAGEAFGPERVRTPNDARVWNAPVVAARFADGLADDEELAAAFDAASDYADIHRWLDYACVRAAEESPSTAAIEVSGGMEDYVADEMPAGCEAFDPVWAEAVWGAGDYPRQVALLRDVFGDPFRPATVDPRWLSWERGTVVRLARQAYEERPFAPMPALAEAMAAVGGPEDGYGGTLLSDGERAWTPGGIDPVRLAVLSDALEEAGCADVELLAHLRSRGPHVRGCWAVDALLGR